jgi:hypothetical protein
MLLLVLIWFYAPLFLNRLWWRRWWWCWWYLNLIDPVLKLSSVFIWWVTITSSTVQEKEYKSCCIPCFTKEWKGLDWNIMYLFSLIIQKMQRSNTQSCFLFLFCFFRTGRLKASNLQGRCPNTWASSPAFFSLLVFQRGLISDWHPPTYTSCIAGITDASTPGLLVAKAGF